MANAEFDGIPLNDLVFGEVRSLEPEHYEDRASRKGANEYEPTESEVLEAIQDPRSTLTRTSSAVVLVGHSLRAGRVLRVVLQPIGHASDGQWDVLTAHAASGRALRDYEEDDHA